MYLSLNTFQHFPHSLGKLSGFLGHWLRKLDGYKCSSSAKSKEATQEEDE
jgi:hypothetical protein